MKKNIIKGILLISLLMIVIFATAQPGPGDTGNNGGAGSNPVGGGAPIDGGISILMMLGAAYGAKKIYKITRTK
jgi:hypothetical protein